MIERAHGCVKETAGGIHSWRSVLARCEARGWKICFAGARYFSVIQWRTENLFRKIQPVIDESARHDAYSHLLIRVHMILTLPGAADVDGIVC